MTDLAFVVLLIAVVFLVLPAARRLSVGRGEIKNYPSWVVRVGNHDVPKVVRANWFQHAAWTARRILPLLAVFCLIAAQNYVLQQPAKFVGLEATDWLTILGIDLAVFCACAPFAKAPRRGPLDKWVTFILAALFAVLAALLIVGQLAARLVAHIWGASESLSAWVQNHPLPASIGWSVGAIGFSLALVAFIEPLPAWQSVSLDPQHSDKLEQAPAKTARRRTSGSASQSAKGAATPRRPRNRRYGGS